MWIWSHRKFFLVYISFRPQHTFFLGQQGDRIVNAERFITFPLQMKCTELPSDPDRPKEFQFSGRFNKANNPNDVIT